MKLLEMLLERGKVFTREAVADASHRLHCGGCGLGPSLEMGNRQNLPHFVGYPRPTSSND
jgi:hypothetical protein